MIVDTSVIVEALVPGPWTASALLLVGSDIQFFAPGHLRVEVGGALTRAVRRRDITVEYATRAYADLPRVLPHLESTASLLDRGFALSLELSHPMYDCLFLAHAEQRAMLLVTADRRFVDKVQTTLYAQRVVHLADWRP